MEITWHKSSKSESACAEATVLDLTVREGVVTGMAPVPLDRVTLDAPARVAVAEGATLAAPATAHDAWDAFAAQDPRRAQDLLVETRQVFRKAKDADVLDAVTSRDDAIKTAFGALTDVDRRAPLASQAGLLYNQVVSGERYPVKAGNPAMVDAVISELTRFQGSEPFLSGGHRQWLAAIRRGEVPLSSGQAAALRGLGVAVPAQVQQFQQSQYAPVQQYGYSSVPGHASGSHQVQLQQPQFQQMQYAPQPQHGYGNAPAQASNLNQPQPVSVADLVDRWNETAPIIGQFAERLPYRGNMLDLLDPRHQLGHLAAFPRDQDGMLSREALRSFERSSTWQIPDQIQRVANFAGVFADGASRSMVERAFRALPPDIAYMYSGLETYLNSGNTAQHRDVNQPLVVVSEQRGGLRINFYQDQRPDHATERRKDRVRSALSLIEAAGYRIPAGRLDVYLPRYVARDTVRPDGSLGRQVVPGFRGNSHFVFPSSILITPNEGAILPPGFQRWNTTTAEASTDAEIDRRGIIDEVEDHFTANAVHELMHWLHYRNVPSAFADSFELILSDADDIEATGSVSAYAGRNILEFVAEFGTARVFGKPFTPEDFARLRELNQAFGGPEPHGAATVARAPQLTPAELRFVQPLVTSRLERDGIHLELSDEQLQYAQSQLQGYQQWSGLRARAQGLADVIAQAARSTSTRGAGPSRQRSGRHDYTVRMSDTSDGMREGLRQVLADDPTKKFDTKQIGVLEGASAQWSDRSSAFDLGRAAPSGTRDSVRDGKRREAPLASLDATPRGFEPVPLEPVPMEPIPLEPVPELLSPEIMSPELTTPEILSYGVNAAPAGVGWAAARWARSWGMSFAPGDPRPFLDAVLAATGGVVTLDGQAVRDAGLLRDELADRLRSDLQTPTADLPWWSAATGVYRSVTRQWMADADPGLDPVQIDRTIDAAIESGEARQSVIALLVGDSPHAALDTPYWTELADQILPFAVSHYLERDLFVLGSGGRAGVYDVGRATAAGGSQWTVLVEAVDGDHRATGWAAAVPDSARGAFDGLSGRQVAWAAEAGLRILGAPGQGARGVTFLDAAGLVLADAEHQRLVEAFGESVPARAVEDDQWLSRAADHLDVGLRVVDQDGTVREYGDLSSGHITLARTTEHTWVALAPARSPQDAAAATRVADVAGAPSIRVLEDLVEDDRLLAVPAVAERDPASAVLSADQERWTASHGRQVTVPPGGDLFDAVLLAADGGLLVDQRLVADADDLRRTLAETSRREQDENLDLWLTVYSLYADHYVRRSEALGSVADPLEAAADVDSRIDTGAAMDDILTSITDPSVWPELADAVAPFLLNLLGVAVRVVRPDGGLDRYGQGRPVYVASVPDDGTSALADGSQAWAALPQRVLRFPATSTLNTLAPPASRLTAEDQDAWLQEHHAVRGPARVGPDGFFEAVLDAVGGRLTSAGLDASSASDLRAALSEHVTTRSSEPLPSLVHATYVFESEARIVQNHFDGSSELADPRAVHDQIADHVRTGDAWHYIAQAFSRPGDWDAITTALAPALLAERAGLDLVVVDDGGQITRYGTADGVRIVLTSTAGQVPAWAPVRPDATQVASDAQAEVRTLDDVFTQETAFVDMTVTVPRQAAESVLDDTQRQVAEDQNLSVVSTTSGTGAFYEAVLASVGGGLLVDRHTYVSSPDQLRSALAGLFAEHPAVLTPAIRETIQRETGRSDTESILEALREPSEDGAAVIGAHLLGPYLGVELHVLTPDGVAAYGGRGRRVVLAPQEQQGGASRWTALADRHQGDPATANASRVALPSLPAHQTGALSLNQQSRPVTRRSQGFQHVAPGKKVSDAGWHKSSYSGEYCVSVSVVAFSVARA